MVPCLGTSTVTCYIESAAGITEGGPDRTHRCLYRVFHVAGTLFRATRQNHWRRLPDQPDYRASTHRRRWIDAQERRFKIDWEDVTESIPAFLTMLMMPLSFSITDGIGFGIISLAFLKLVTGRRKEIHPVIYYFATLLRRLLHRRFCRNGIVRQSSVRFPGGNLSVVSPEVFLAERASKECFFPMCKDTVKLQEYVEINSVSRRTALRQ